MEDAENLGLRKKRDGFFTCKELKLKTNTSFEESSDRVAKHGHCQHC